MAIEITDLQGQIHNIDFDNFQSDYINVDCMDALRKLPDKCIDLAVVDPPYGDVGGYGITRSEDASEGGLTSTTSQTKMFHRFGNRNGRFERYRQKGIFPSDDDRIIHWDIAPTQEYFDELFRVSKNQVIWGANYFSMPPCRCFLVWRKLTISEVFSMAMCEYAWTSYHDKNAKWFGHTPQGNPNNPRIHPTEKPIDLYKWVYSLFAKKGMVILDTHCGSANSLRAAHDLGLKYLGFEIDEYYYKQSKERLDNYCQQVNIFDFLDMTESEKKND